MTSKDFTTLKTCCIKDCTNKQRSSGINVCEKHYYRMRRNGKYELDERSGECLTSHGYITKYAPNHPLSNNRNRAYKHRFVFFNEVSETVDSCDLCNAEVSWSTVHIDHIDENKQNNEPSNLRPLCNGCNTQRNRKLERGAKLFFTISGVKHCAEWWAKQADVKIVPSTILRRYHRGLNDYDCVYGKKLTHNGNKPCRALV